MEIVRIRDIVRRDVPLYYRNKYNAIAHINLTEKKLVNINIEFAIEVTPISGKEYSIEDMEEMDYPTLPVKQALIEEIKKYDREGLLP